MLQDRRYLIKEADETSFSIARTIRREELVPRRQKRGQDEELAKHSYNVAVSGKDVHRKIQENTTKQELKEKQ